MGYWAADPGVVGQGGDEPVGTYVVARIVPAFQQRSYLGNAKLNAADGTHESDKRICSDEQQKMELIPASADPQMW